MTIYQNRLSIKPVCDSRELAIHRNYLRNKKNNAPPDIDVSLLENRIKSMNTNRLVISYPDSLKRNITFMRELDYFMIFLKNVKNPIKRVKFGNQEKYIPVIYLDYLNEKINIFKEKYNNIQAAVILAESL